MHVCGSCAVKCHAMRTARSTRTESPTGWFPCRRQHAVPQVRPPPGIDQLSDRAAERLALTVKSRPSRSTDRSPTEPGKSRSACRLGRMSTPGRVGRHPDVKAAQPWPPAGSLTAFPRTQIPGRAPRGQLAIAHRPAHQIDLLVRSGHPRICHHIRSARDRLHAWLIFDGSCQVHHPDEGQVAVVLTRSRP